MIASWLIDTTALINAWVLMYFSRETCCHQTKESINPTFIFVRKPFWPHIGNIFTHSFLTGIFSPNVCLLCSNWLIVLCCDWLIALTCPWDWMLVVSTIFRTRSWWMIKYKNITKRSVSHFKVLLFSDDKTNWAALWKACNWVGKAFWHEERGEAISHEWLVTLVWLPLKLSKIKSLCDGDERQAGKEWPLSASPCLGKKIQTVKMQRPNIDPAGRKHRRTPSHSVFILQLTVMLFAGYDKNSSPSFDFRP